MVLNCGLNALTCYVWWNILKLSSLLEILIEIEIFTRGASASLCCGHFGCILLAFMVVLVFRVLDIKENTTISVFYSVLLFYLLLHALQINTVDSLMELLMPTHSWLNSLLHTSQNIYSVPVSGFMQIQYSCTSVIFFKYLPVAFSAYMSYYELEMNIIFDSLDMTLNVALNFVHYRLLEKGIAHRQQLLHLL